VNVKLPAHSSLSVIITETTVKSLSIDDDDDVDCIDFFMFFVTSRSLVSLELIDECIYSFIIETIHCLEFILG